MRLCAIFICWADWEMLKYSLFAIDPLVDGVFIVGSEYSNFGEFSAIPEAFKKSVAIREPQFKTARESETDKRNYGLQLAKRAGFTHFLMLDTDEMYQPEHFLRAKDRILNEGLAGLVCPTRVYFGKPNLTIGFDGTLVPFIHKLTPNIQFGINKLYPFSWDKKRIRIDPTRQMNITSGVDYTEEIVCEHFSWCRGDYQKKIRNSTARTNLERSTILEDLANAAPGVFCKFYKKTLTECANPFGIPIF